MFTCNTRIIRLWRPRPSIENEPYLVKSTTLILVTILKLQPSPDNPKSILVSCWTGNYHLGDEAILSGLAVALRKEAIRLDVVSDNPAWTTVHHRIPSVCRPPRATWRGLGLAPFRCRQIFRYISAVRIADLCLLGGGGLFFDEASVKDWVQELKIPQIFGKPTGLVGIGVDALPSSAIQRLATIVHQTAFISVRDRESLERMRTWFPKAKIELSADLAFLLANESRGTPHRRDARRAVLFLRRWPDFEEGVAESVRRLSQTSSIPISILPLQKTHFCDDEAYGREVAAQAGNDLSALDYPPSLADLREQIGRYGFTVSMRMHGILLAALQGIPSIGIACCEKVRIIQEQLGLGNFVVNAEGLRNGELTQKVQALLADYPNYISILRNRVSELSTLADVNRQLVLSALRKGDSGS